MEFNDYDELAFIKIGLDTLLAQVTVQSKATGYGAETERKLMKMIIRLDRRMTEMRRAEQLRQRGTEGGGVPSAE